MADLAGRLGRLQSIALPARRAGASTPVDRRTRRWRAATAPFWAWSDQPAPDWPARQRAPGQEVGPAGVVFLDGLDAVRRRLWLRGLVQSPIRGAWLALTLAAVWMAASLLVGGPALNLRLLAWVVGAAVVAGLAFALLAKPSRRRTAQMLDRTFGLQERMTTAVDDLGLGVPEAGERAPVVYLQMADAANVIDVLRSQRTLGFRVPVREIVLTVFWGLTLAALVFLRGVGGDPPALGAGIVPPFTPAVERPEQPDAAPAAAADANALTVEEVKARADRSNQARQDLQALADALADHAVTRDASTAIQQGAFEAAADDLRELAIDADKVSPDARSALAGDLDAAAQRMAPEGQGLRQSSQEAASGLRQGDRPAQEGLRSLAEAVERTGEQVAPQSELADQMRQAQAARAQGQEAGQQSQQAQPGEPGSEGGQPGQPQSGADPGQGADASGQSGQPGEQASEGGQSAGEQGQGEQAGQSSQGGQQGQQSGGQEAAAEQAGGGRQAQTTEGAAAQGGGSSSGGSPEEARVNAQAAGGGQETASQEGAVEQRVVDGNGATGEQGPPGEVTESLALPPGGGQGAGVQTSNDGGSALIGSGTGATAGGGDATQQEVGEAGPDSNHVPADYRDVVERYFSDDGGAP